MSSQESLALRSGSDLGQLCCMLCFLLCHGLLMLLLQLSSELLGLPCLCFIMLRLELSKCRLVRRTHSVHLRLCSTLQLQHLLMGSAQRFFMLLGCFQLGCRGSSFLGSLHATCIAAGSSRLACFDGCKQLTLFTFVSRLFCCLQRLCFFSLSSILSCILCSCLSSLGIMRLGDFCGLGSDSALHVSHHARLGGTHLALGILLALLTQLQLNVCLGMLLLFLHKLGHGISISLGSSLKAGSILIVQLKRSGQLPHVFHRCFLQPLLARFHSGSFLFVGSRLLQLLQLCFHSSFLLVSFFFQLLLHCSRHSSQRSAMCRSFTVGRGQPGSRISALCGTGAQSCHFIPLFGFGLLLSLQRPTSSNAGSDRVHWNTALLLDKGSQALHEPRDLRGADGPRGLVLLGVLHAILHSVQEACDFVVHGIP